MTTVSRAAVLAALIAPAGGCAGGPRPAAAGETGDRTPAECSELDCLDGVHLSVVSAAATFTPGGYAVTFTQGEFVETCGFELLDGVDLCGLESPCLGATDCDASFGFIGPNHSIAFFVELAGFGGGVSTSGGTSSDETGTDSTDPRAPLLEIVITRGNAVVFAEVLAPQYVEVAPNGQGCEPVCLVGQAAVVLPPT